MPLLNDDGTVKKAGTWAFILYPDSASDDWEQILIDSYEDIVISPLHDKDIVTKGERKGQPDKPHFHIMVLFHNRTTSTRSEELAHKVNGSGVIPISSAWNYFVYLDHSRVDNKQLYSHKDIKIYGTLTEADIKIESQEEQRRMNRFILAQIKENHITELADLIDYLGLTDLDMQSYACKKSNFYNAYITSYRNSMKAREFKANAETKH